MLPGAEPSDLVTPATAARYLGKPAGTVRCWISRFKVKPAGVIAGRNVYDFRELARIDARMRAAARAARAQAA